MTVTISSFSPKIYKIKIPNILDILVLDILERICNNFIKFHVGRNPKKFKTSFPNVPQLGPIVEAKSFDSRHLRDPRFAKKTLFEGLSSSPLTFSTELYFWFLCRFRFFLRAKSGISRQLLFKACLWVNPDYFLQAPCKKNLLKYAWMGVFFGIGFTLNPSKKLSYNFHDVVPFQLSLDQKNTLPSIIKRKSGRPVRDILPPFPRTFSCEVLSSLFDSVEWSVWPRTMNTLLSPSLTSILS